MTVDTVSASASALAVAYTQCFSLSIVERTKRQEAKYKSRSFAFLLADGLEESLLSFLP